MALIDDLINRIAQADLRKELSAAITEMRENQRFGLVFENHVPETVTLPKMALEPGMLVRPKDELHKDSVYQIESLNGKSATIVPIDGGGQKTVPKSDIWAIKRFGDPIYPALKSLSKTKRGAADSPFHAIINGENFHALQLLLFLYEGKVDCIYIDPPYNSGARDWKYNNRYVDDKDYWRHSKWLSFIEKRLALVKRLLKPDGTLVVTIDKNEHYNLGVLLEQEFKKHDVTSVCIVHNSTGAQGDNFSYTNEFAVFVTPAGKKVITPRTVGEDSTSLTGLLKNHDGTPVEGGTVEFRLDGTTATATTDARGKFAVKVASEATVPLRDWGPVDSNRLDAANCFYPILIKDGKVIGFGDDRTKDADFHPSHEVAKKDGVIEIWPVDAKGVEKKWRYARQTVERIKDNLFVKIVSGKPEIIRKRTHEPHKTVWYGKRYDAKYYGTQLVRKLTGVDFPYPKSVLAVKDTLYACVAQKPNALILDFFAGSATTFHATCMLNKEDGGHRRCIVVTNNEVAEKESKSLRKKGLFPGDVEYEKHGIFEAVTAPRCKAVVTGKDPDGNPVEGELDGQIISDGYAENVEFFRLVYLDPDEVDLGKQYDAILPSLWLSAGGIGPREKETAGGYSMPDGSTYAVLLDERRFKTFLSALKKRNDIKRAWLVTDSVEAFAEMRSRMPTGLDVSMLYRDYLRTFAINTRLML